MEGHDMKMLPLQMVIIDMENGQRGVFIGRPLVTVESDDDDCQVENVWFTDIHEMPDTATLEQIAKMTLEEIQSSTTRTLQ
jgi:hypothetical protein